MSKSRAFTFTVNNYTDSDIKALKLWDCRYMIFQEEKGKNGTPHLQGYFYHENKRTFSGTLKKLSLLVPHLHLEIAFSTPTKNKAYCSKISDRISGTEVYEAGEFPQQGLRTDLIDICEKLRMHTITMKEIAVEHPVLWIQYGKRLTQYAHLFDEPRDWKTEVIVYWGPSGTGKSWRVQREARIGAYHMLITTKDRLPFFDGYHGQEDVIIDEYRGEIPFPIFLQMLDRYPLTVQIKGSSATFLAKRIFITSNLPPHRWYPFEEDVKPLLRRLTKVEHMETPYIPLGEDIRRYNLRNRK